MKSLARNAGVWRWLFKDELQKRLMPLAAIVAYICYRIIGLWNEPRALRYLMSAHRYHSSPWLTRAVVEELPAIQRHAMQLLDYEWAGSLGAHVAEHVARRSIVLKWPQRGAQGIEKGVLLITFTTSFSYYHSTVDLQLLQRWFTIVLEPSWAGYCVADILFWAGKDSPPVIVQATEKLDREFIGALNTNLVAVDFGASNWVDDRVFYPLPGVDKQYDVVYVGNYRPIKRHHVLFRAIKQINDPTYKAALACTPWGGGNSKQVVQDLLDRYGVRDNVVVHEGLSAAELNHLLNASKACVLLSLKEGSNRAIFEGFFANLPAIVLRDNIGVNKDYVNAATGHLIGESELADSLRFFREQWRQYQPRQWAMQNISAEVTTRNLEQTLQRLARERDEPWSEGLRVKVNRPEVEYLEDLPPFPLSTLQLLQLFARDNVEAHGRIESVLLGHAAVSEFSC